VFTVEAEIFVAETTSSFEDGELEVEVPVEEFANYAPTGVQGVLK